MNEPGLTLEVMLHDLQLQMEDMQCMHIYSALKNIFHYFFHFLQILINGI